MGAAACARCGQAAGLPVDGESGCFVVRSACGKMPGRAALSLFGSLDQKERSVGS